jgi:uncharacterized protein
VITPHLISMLRNRFSLDWQGVHGAPHWARVRENGLKLTEFTGANTRVVELFAFIHDSCRENEWRDPQHGLRAGAFVKTLAGTVLTLNQAEIKLLVVACEGHSDGLLQEDITVCTCWDADRLDLGRVGIRPDPTKLCTTAAKLPEMIEWAYKRSIKN